jgi:hypothetical protein
MLTMTETKSEYQSHLRKEFEDVIETIREDCGIIRNINIEVTKQFDRVKNEIAPLFEIHSADVYFEYDRKNFSIRMLNRDTKKEVEINCNDLILGITIDGNKRFKSIKHTTTNHYGRELDDFIRKNMNEIVKELF